MFNLLVKLFITISLLSFISCSNTDNEASPCLDVSIEKIQFTPKERIVIFGEIHGNDVSPEFLFHAVCKQLIESNNTITVTLEMDSDLQPKIDSYLNSEGSLDDRNQLLNHRFWDRSKYNSSGIPIFVTYDGRSSIAILDLIESFRKALLNYPKRISLHAIDGEIPRFSELYLNNERDLIMANNYDELSKESENTYLYGLIGNRHSRNYPPEAYPNQVTTAMLIKNPRETISLWPLEGTTWSCTGSCGPNNLGKFPQEDLQDIELYKSYPSKEWDTIIYLPKATASPPAIELLKESE